MTKITLPEPQRNRTGTGNYVNLIMHMTIRSVERVRKCIIPKDGAKYISNTLKQET